MLAAALSSHVRSELRNRRFFANRVPHRNCRPSGWKEPLRMTGIDWLILGLYFAVVTGIGAAMKGPLNTSTDFFFDGRAIRAWVCGLAFMSASLGAEEVIGISASRPW